MSKKRLIVIIIAGLISFSGTFLFAWFTKPVPQEQAVEPDETASGIYGMQLKLLRQGTDTAGAVGLRDSGIKRAMTEEKLKNLIYDVREKLREYENKSQDLELTAQRLQMSQDVLKKDIERLDNLRVELASIVSALKAERDRLLKSRVKIARTEKENLMSIAATYDKMDSVSAGKILANITQMQSDGGSFDDAVKILHYMTERTKAKLLAGMVASEPKLAAVLCHRLKQIVEEE